MNSTFNQSRINKYLLMKKQAESLKNSVPGKARILETINFKINQLQNHENTVQRKTIRG
jgi:hypothetical protein